MLRKTLKPLPSFVSKEVCVSPLWMRPWTPRVRGPVLARAGVLPLRVVE